MTFKNSSLLVPVLVIMILTCTISTLGQKYGMENGMSGQKDNIKPIGEAPVSFLRLSDAERRSFIERVKKIPIGESREVTEHLLGNPWSDQVLSSKREPKFIGRLVKYYLIKNKKHLVNEKLDQYVLFTFDKNDRLQEVTSTVPGLESRP
ncbi:MAG: hypothetical protein JWN45_867 [Acidobacteriaceae bacterium]|nr:hypothetical protein [Acidobacteriaceae bacterium]